MSKFKGSPQMVIYNYSFIKMFLNVKSRSPKKYTLPIWHNRWVILLKHVSLNINMQTFWFKDITRFDA